MRPIFCSHCGRVLAKLDQDGTLHIRHASSGIEFIATVSRILFICPKIYYSKDGKVSCGRRTFYESPAQADMSTAHELAHAC